MNALWKRAILTSLILIFSSLAGCLGTEDSDAANKNPEAYGSVMVSTYHVGELVQAIAGDDVNMQYISQDNIPVHDYEPSAQDLVRLQDADVFFYHGLGLEPWVDDALESLGNDAPTAIEVHTMPTGTTTLDYESMLVSDLCEVMADGPFESVELVDDEDHAEDAELHAEYTAHQMSFPEDMHHDEEDHDEDEHDDHDEHDEHDDHDEHNEHAHLEAEETMENACTTTSSTSISIFHLEEGEYVLEFENEHMENFTMAVLKMGGGHAHHDHGDHDDHRVCHDMSTHTNTNHTSEADCEAAGHMWMEEDDHDDHDDITAEEAMQMADSNNDSHLSWDEFWVMFDMDDHDDHDQDDHDENETHDDHAENETHDEHDEEMMVKVYMAMFNDSDMDGDTLLSMDELTAFIETMEDMEDGDLSPELMVIMYDMDGDGLISMDEFSEMMEMDDHDDHDDGHDENETHDGHDENETHDGHDNEAEDLMDALMEMMFNSMDANNDSYLNADELLTFFEMDEDHDVAFASLHVRAEGEYGFALPAGVTMHILEASGHEGHDDHGHDVHDEDEHDEDEHDEDEHDEDEHDDHGEEETLNYDPHSWLNPLAFKAQVDVVLNGLTSAFPDGEENFKSNAEDYAAELTALDASYVAAFGENGTCSTDGGKNSVAANHNAYSYISVQYDIQFVTVHGLDPEGEPSPEDVAEVVEFIKEEGITVLFVEEYTDQSAVQSIVDETGVIIKTLYTMEMAPSDANDDYMTMMNKNLDNLIAGIGC